MGKEFRMPTQAEINIMTRNGVSADAVTVVLSNEDTLVLRHCKTGDDIFIHAGCRPWSRYEDSQTPGK